MTKLKLICAGASLSILGACAGLQFEEGRNGNGVVFYDSIPHVVVGCSKEGETTFSVVAIPDTSHPRTVSVRSGWGASKVGLTFSNGMIASLNQESDPQMQHAGALLGAIAGVVSFADPATTQPRACSNVAGVYRIVVAADGQTTSFVRVSPP